LAVLVLVVASVLVGPAASARAATVDVWIGAVPASWNVMPTGVDPISGMTFPRSETTMPTVVYKRFTPRWARMTPNLPNVYGDNDGIVGPLIRARVGDDIRVHFKNMDTLYARPHSMHFHGVRYPFGSDGAYIPGVSGRGANVKPGRTFTYRLHAMPASRGVWPYHDHSPSMTDSIEGGMYGALSILGRHERKPDRENVVFFESQLGFFTINGRAFIRNTPTFTARVGELVQWDVLALGSDHHTFHIHGHRWKSGDHFIDTRTIGPAESFRIRFKEDIAGTWLYHCHVEAHMMAGMQGLYKVLPRRRS